MRKVLAIVLWAWIPFCWQPLWGQAPSVGVKSSQDKKQKPTLGANKTKNDQRGTDAVPLVIETHTRPDSPEEATKHKAKNYTKEYRDRWTFRLTVSNAIATGVLVIFTGGLLIVGWRGVRLARSTLTVIQGQLAEIQSAGKQTDRMIEAARDQVRISELSMIAGNRAYVHLNAFRWISHPYLENSNEAYFWRIWPSWINSGNTPTSSAW